MDAPPVQYARTSDGYDIAYTVSGAGEPFVFMPTGVSHVQLAWDVPGNLSPWLRALAQRFRLVHYDSRGQGLSSRGLPPDFAFSDFEKDLQAVLDALKLEQVVLLGSTQFSHTAVRFAFENPNRVRALILVHSAASLAAYPIPLWLNVARENWEFFLQTIATGQTAHAKHNAVERYRQMTTQADWLATVQAFGQSDISSLLSAIKAPTLVLHAREFPQLKIEEATRLAAQIHGARLYVSDGGGTFTNLDQSLPAIESFLESLTDDAPPSVPQGDHVSLSPREVEVLRLLGAGRTNQQIADELVISLNTVRRHVSNLFAKTGVVNRAQAAVYARTRGLV